MSFSSAGEFRTVLQQYKYGPHQIFCVIKILPDKVCFYEKEPENDFNWMTAARWAKLESSLWRIFASLANWKQDARLLKTELVVDHINVSIKATEKFLSAARTLLMNEALSQNDLELEIVLRYMSHEDSTIVSALPIKRKHSVEVKPTQMLNGSDKANKNPIDSSSAISTKPDKTKQVKLRDNINELSNRKRPASATTSRKRERRSISHDSHHHKHLPQPNNSEPSSRGSRTPKPSKSPLPRPDSAELRPERRSARSPKKPSHYAEYIIGQIKTQKSKSKTSENNVESSSDKKSSKRQDSLRNKAGSSSVANGNTAVVPNTWKYEQLDGARINVEALKKINDMLDVPKPREVEILLLDDMDEAAVLNTFETYREDFDRLFKERQHKFQTISFMSIDHCHIMDILNKTIRDNMIKKLGEVYSKSGPHGSLVINGLLPLWIIRLFMDKYKFTQDEAVRQIADQLKYNTYLKAVNNDPLSSDLED